MHPVCTPESAVLVLNGCLELDREAVTRLVSFRTECNRGLADHPAVQVMAKPGEPFKVGLLGVLNGLFGTLPDGWGFIQAHFDEDSGQILRFSLVEPSEHGGAAEEGADQVQSGA